MNKYFEAFDNIIFQKRDNGYISDIYRNDICIVYNALQRLNAIDNSNPSEALERTSSEFIDGYPTGNVNVGMTWEELSAIKQALQRLQSIDSTTSSNALKELEYIGKNCYIEAGNAEEDCILYAENYIGYDTIKNYILKTQGQEQKLNKVEKLTQLLFRERKKIGQEYIKWCEKNNVAYDNVTNMITWVLCIKLKEVLENEENRNLFR